MALTIWEALSVGAVVLVAGSIVLGVWLYLKRRFADRLMQRARREARRLTEESKREAESVLKEARVEAREELLKSRQEFEEESRERRRELGEMERRFHERQEKLEQRASDLAEREQELEDAEKSLRERRRRTEEVEAETREAREEAVRRLERVAGLTTEEAKQTLIDRMESDAREEAARIARRIEEEAKEKASRKANRIIATAIQRSSGNHVAENTVAVVELPSDDMKGRVIGREGRNIRAFEMITGVNLIVDDTPEAVLISGFDPFRREVAKIALERLVDDGRIHPARIEEVVDKVQDEMGEQIRENGKEAAEELAIHDLDPELTRHLGLLKYRTSYGQNVLYHSMEVGRIAGIMAAELGADEAVARRGGLLHDIGKAVDHEVEGTHLTIGIDLLRRHGESEAVIQAMEAHHFDVEPATVEAVLVQAADALSAARPGARRDMLETYVKRLQKLEEIADSFRGVNKAYAIQAGRELRIIVEPSEVSDDEAIWLSKDISRRIEKEVQYPGEIKVTVIRETRAVEHAR